MQPSAAIDKRSTEQHSPSGLGLQSDERQPGARSDVVPSSEQAQITAAALGAELCAAAEHNPEWLAWLARERERSAEETKLREQAPSMGPRSRSQRTIAEFAARAQAASAIPPIVPADTARETAAIAAVPPLASQPAAVSAAPPHRLTRAQWHKRELDALRLQARIERRRKAKLEHKRELHADAVEWGPERERKSIEARAKARKLIEGPVSGVRAWYMQLASHPSTAHFAIGIKKLCDLHEWTLADLAAQRSLTLLYFLLEMANMCCWNARYAARPRRRGGRLTGFAASLNGRKYSPCVRAVAQPFLCTVLAWRGHTTEDSRSVDRSTVSDHALRLEAVGLIDVVQVPQHAAEPHEIGDSGHVINRYWLADKGCPKPALLGLWTADGACIDADVLTAPWLGARVLPQPTVADSPPPPS